MNLNKRSKSNRDVRLNLSPMIDVVFLILIYFIVSLKMDPTLDEIIRIPEAYHSQEQPEARFQVYVLKARVEKDGTVNPDSSGLIALVNRGNPDSIFVKLDELPDKLKEKRKEVLDLIVKTKNFKRQKDRYAPLSTKEVGDEEDSMILMIKADNMTFYGRILQVVEKAKEIGVRKFALVTTVESSKYIVEKNKSSEKM